MNGVEDLFDMLCDIIIDRDVEDEFETETKYKQCVMQFTDINLESKSVLSTVRSDGVTIFESENHSCESKRLNCLSGKSNNHKSPSSGSKGLFLVDKGCEFSENKNKVAKYRKNKNNEHEIDLNEASNKNQVLWRSENLHETCVRQKFEVKSDIDHSGFTCISDESDLESNVIDSNADRRKRKQSFPKRTLLPIKKNLKNTKKATTCKCLNDEVNNIKMEEIDESLTVKTSDEILGENDDDDDGMTKDSGHGTDQNELKLHSSTDPSPMKSDFQSVKGCSLGEKSNGFLENSVSNSLEIKSKLMLAFKINTRKKAGKIWRNRGNKIMKTRSKSARNHEFYKCDKCIEQFSELKTLMSHKYLVHNEKLLNSQTCNKELLNSVQSPEKSIMENIGNLFSCKLCGKSFSRKGVLYKHYRTHPEGRLACLRCGVFCNTETELLEHVEEHKRQAKHKCKSCNMSFSRAQQYESHLAGHAANMCCTCKLSVSSREKLIRHRWLAHSIRDELDLPRAAVLKFGCNFCDKRYAKEKLLAAHVRVHSGEKPFECAECKLYFRTRKALSKHHKTNSHMVKAGDTTMERKYLCQDCGKAYFRKHALQRHMRFHLGEKQHMCQFCGYKCQEVNNLKRHMALHFESQRNFVCEICGAAFHAKKTLETHHQYKHSDERNFECPQCPLSFKAKSALRRHSKVHSLEKEHSCWCGAAFKRMYNLRRHLRKVHGTDEMLPPVKHVTTLDCLKKLPVSKTDHTEELESSSDINQLLKNIEQSHTMSRSCESASVSAVDGKAFDPSYSSQHHDIENADTCFKSPSIAASLCSSPELEPMQPSVPNLTSPNEDSQTKNAKNIHEYRASTVPVNSSELKMGSFYLPHLTVASNSFSENQTHVPLLSPSLQLTQKPSFTERPRSTPSELNSSCEYRIPSFTDTRFSRNLTAIARPQSTPTQALISPERLQATTSEGVPRLSFILNNDISSRMSDGELALSHLQKLTQDQHSGSHKYAQFHPRVLHESIHDQQKGLHNNTTDGAVSLHIDNTPVQQTALHSNNTPVQPTALHINNSQVQQTALQINNTPVQQTALHDDFYSRLVQEDLTQRLIHDSQRMSHTDFLQRLNPREYGFVSRLLALQTNPVYEPVLPLKPAAVGSSQRSPPERAGGEFNINLTEAESVNYSQSRRELAAESLAQMAALVNEASCYATVPNSQIL